MNDRSIETELVVRHEHGLHARPAAAFVRKAASFQADIRIQNLHRGAEFHDAKSLTDLLLARVDCNHRIRLVASGADAQEAVEALTALLNEAARKRGG